MTRKDAILKNFVADMPRCSVTIDSVTPESPQHAIKMFKKKAHRNKYMMMMLCNASVMARPYEILYDKYCSKDNLYISDSNTPLEIDIDTTKNEFNYKKVLKLVDVGSSLTEIGQSCANSSSMRSQ